MPPAPNTLHRLLELLPALQKRDGQRVDDVCADLEVSRRELQRFLELLTAARYADWSAGDLIDAWIEDERLHVHTGAMPGSVVRFTAEEQLALRLGYEFLRVRGEMPEAKRVEHLLELMYAEQAEDEEGVQRLQERIAVSPRPSIDAKLPEMIGEALRQKRCLELVYYSRGRDKTDLRVVECWELYHDRQFSYLFAWDRTRAAERTFRLDRVIQARLLNDVVTQPVRARDFPEGDAGTELRACVILRGFLERLAKEEAWSECVPVEGGLQWTPVLENPAWLLNLLLPYAHECQLVSPENLRDQLRQRLCELRTSLLMDGTHKE